MARQKKFGTTSGPTYQRRKGSETAEANRMRHSQYHLRQGMELERAQIVAFLRIADGIGSGEEAAARIERGEHRQ